MKARRTGRPRAATLISLAIAIAASSGCGSEDGVASAPTSATRTSAGFTVPDDVGPFLLVATEGAAFVVERATPVRLWRVDQEGIRPVDLDPSVADQASILDVRGNAAGVSLVAVRCTDGVRQALDDRANADSCRSEAQEIWRLAPDGRLVQRTEVFRQEPEHHDDGGLGRSIDLLQVDPQGALWIWDSEEGAKVVNPEGVISALPTMVPFDPCFIGNDPYAVDSVGNQVEDLDAGRLPGYRVLDLEDLSHPEVVPDSQTSSAYGRATCRPDSIMMVDGQVTSSGGQAAAGGARQAWTPRGGWTPLPPPSTDVLHDAPAATIAESNGALYRLDLSGEVLLQRDDGQVDQIEIDVGTPEVVEGEPPPTLIADAFGGTTVVCANWSDAFTKEQEPCGGRFD